MVMTNGPDTMYVIVTLIYMHNQILWLGTIQAGSESSIGGNVYKESIVYFLHCMQTNIWKVCTLEEAIEFM